MEEPTPKRQVTNYNMLAEPHSPVDSLVPCSYGRKLTSFLGWQQAAWNYSACPTGQESSKQMIFREQMSHRNLSPYINETHYPSKSYKPVSSSVLYRCGASCCHLSLTEAVGTQAARILPLLPREPGDLALEENTH